MLPKLYGNWPMDDTTLEVACIGLIDLGTVAQWATRVPDNNSHPKSPTEGFLRRAFIPHPPMNLPSSFQKIGRHNAKRSRSLEGRNFFCIFKNATNNVLASFKG